MKKIIAIFGTRPEAIKMCPLILELKKFSTFKTIVCISGQHKEMLEHVLDYFNILPDYNLEIMKDQQSLSDITSRILVRFNEVLRREKPELVLVHGDTSTAFSAAIACFYNNIRVGHVEAGLRTYNIVAPYPEEFNRRTISLISYLDFAPSIFAKDNLIHEGKRESNIFVTGSTIYASLSRTIRDDYTSDILSWGKDSKLVLLTAHRRESMGDPLKNILRATKRVVNEVSDCKIIFPVHLNPLIKSMVFEEFQNIDRIKLVAPFNMIDFHNILARSDLVLTDSGGVQEEAAILGVPTLILRNVSERPLSNESRATQSIIGMDENNIYSIFKKAITNTNKEEKKVKKIIDNDACLTIATIINNYLLEN